MARYKVSVNVQSSLKKANDSIDWTKALTALGLAAIRFNRERIVKNNENVDGTRFRRYTKEYSRKKILTGRSGDPNLTLTGNLLKSMAILSLNLLAKIVIIGFSGSSNASKLRAKAGIRSKGKKRKFLKATKYTVTDTTKQISNRLKAVGN